jgi:O-antigen ligase
MAKKNFPPNKIQSDAMNAPGPVTFLRNSLVWCLSITCGLVGLCVYLRTYDSARTKITLFQLGITVCLVLFLALLWLEKRNVFSKKNLPVIAPFVAYAIYVIFSFLHFPYKSWAIEDFIKYVFYMIISIIVISEFTHKSVDRFTKTITFFAWIIMGYGILQVIDTRFFMSSRDVSVGLDPLIWRGFFVKRIFSTMANPNFFGDFVIIVFFIVTGQYLKTKKNRHLVLMTMSLACLYFTETKGAWLGFAFGFVVFIIIHSLLFWREYYKKNKLKINLVALGILVFCSGIVGYYAKKRMMSVNFRVFTWLSTFQMIENSPLIGNGVGSFKIIYPAYRRPQIFELENRHNNATDHAENEFLEQWSDNGILGFGLFLWIIIFVLTVGLKGLYRQTEHVSNGKRAPPESYDLLGYMTALVAMFAHSFVDISVRFVSSGIYLAVLPGVIILLARGKSFQEEYYLENKFAANDNMQSKVGNSIVTFIFLLFCILSFAVFSVLIIREFSVAQGFLSPYIRFGDLLLRRASWMVLIFVLIGVGFLFAKSLLLTRSKLLGFLILLSLYPMYWFWGTFKSEIYLNMGIYFSYKHYWGKALENYTKAIENDSTFPMSHYFRANVFRDMFANERTLNRTYHPEWGDRDNISRNNFERSLDGYDDVSKIAPNYVQIHYLISGLYGAMAAYQYEHGEQHKSYEYFQKSLKSLEFHHNIDPVDPMPYYSEGRIYMSLGQYGKAEQVFLECMYPEYGKWKHQKREYKKNYLLLYDAYLGQRKFSSAADSLKAAFEVAKEKAKQRLQAYETNPEKYERLILLAKENLNLKIDSYAQKTKIFDREYDFLIKQNQKPMDTPPAQDDDIYNKWGIQKSMSQIWEPQADISLINDIKTEISYGLELRNIKNRYNQARILAIHNSRK